MTNLNENELIILGFCFDVSASGGTITAILRTVCVFVFSSFHQVIEIVSVQVPQMSEEELQLRPCL